MKNLTDWDKHTPEERKSFLVKLGVDKQINLDTIINKPWDELDFYTQWSLIIYIK